MMELLIVVVVVGILAVIGTINYRQSVREAHDREAIAYLQVLRQAALAYYQTWHTYPTDVDQVPEAMVPPDTQTSSRWAYSFSGADPTAWTLPTADEKNGNGFAQILENGTIQ